MAVYGLSSYGKAPGKINTYYMPAARREYTVDFERLDGGLNLWELDYRLDANESPEMKNMLWRDGVLGCRDGQSYLIEDGPGVGRTMHREPFWGYLFAHIGDSVYYCDPDADEAAWVRLCDGAGDVRGTFFRYGDYLFYKTKGVYKRITYKVDAETPFEAEDVVGYVPITYINALAATGTGTAYQPENRLSAQKTIWYNASLRSKATGFAGDGKTNEFTIDDAQFYATQEVTVNGATSAAWYMDGKKLVFYSAPAEGAVILVVYQVPTADYYLPVKDVNTRITKIFAPLGASAIQLELAPSTAALTADPTEWNAEWDGEYVFWPETGHILFKSAPYVTTPQTNNTVQVTYELENADSYNSIMDCRYAIVYGGATEVCVVLGGCPAQPNAYFWNGNNIAMDPSYFPQDQYNLAGDTEEEITGFGKQQNLLVIFKTTSIGKAELGTTTTGESRVRLTMDYAGINSRIGCDLPWSIQLVDNNLVFCNREQGVFLVADSSAAYENNIVQLSKKVDGNASRLGLLNDIRAEAVDNVVSVNDNTRYWIVANGKAYVWDYELSTRNNPSWFYFTNVDARSFAADGERLRHLNSAGQLSLFSAQFTDYGGPIEKVYRFATQHFGSYDRLKDVVSVILAIRSDTDTDIKLTYKTDYETRDDLTPITSYSWRLSPRNLAYRYLHVNSFAGVERRVPGCHHIRHFTMILTNNTAGMDMSVVSAQIFYKNSGRLR